MKILRKKMTKNTAFCQHESGSIGCDACPIVVP